MAIHALPEDCLLDTGLAETISHSNISISTAASSSKESKPLTVMDRISKGLKIALPHVGLYIFIFCYLCAGAYVFHLLEDATDKERQRTKLSEIRAVYSKIAAEMKDECGAGLDEGRLYAELSRISTFMEMRPFRLYPDKEPDVDELLPPRWVKMPSFLFALSILTTTGYAYANPVTGIGQSVAIAYGLIGIPIMILAAIDIGRFLSVVVLWVWTTLDDCVTLPKALKRSMKKPSIVSQVETKAINILKEKARRRSWRGKGIHHHLEEAERLTNKKPKPAPPENPDEKPKRRLPLSVNASFLLLFCMLGGLFFVAAGNEKTFIEGFFVTFNLVANLTMSEMPSDLSHMLTLFYIAFFVIFGVAVLSMCADLAATDLKWIFLKIHYFGRKINWKRKDAKRDEMEVEVKELLKIISQIRAKYPEKDTITPVDILQYMQEVNSSTESEYLNTDHRRDTIAFMPQSIEALKFADDIELDDGSHRMPATPSGRDEKASVISMSSLEML
uniref:Ion_trans_2 domain-containing protein n=1 Tax=Panagrellus redivivus TaxID=6233 RepID=A0A7E4UYS7_PANRE